MEKRAGEKRGGDARKGRSPGMAGDRQGKSPRGQLDQSRDKRGAAPANDQCSSAHLAF